MSQNELPHDDELIPKLLEFDEVSYRQVVAAYHSTMVYVARAIVGESIADEVAQEAWVAVLRALPKFERRSSLKTWIMRIVANCAKSRLRHESRTVQLNEALDDSAPILGNNRFSEQGMWQSPPYVWHADTPEALLSSSEVRKVIDTALQQLPALQRAVITLRDIQCMDMEIICKILDISESNSRVLLHRARNHVHEAIDQYHRTEQ